MNIKEKTVKLAEAVSELLLEFKESHEIVGDTKIQVDDGLKDLQARMLKCEQNIESRATEVEKVAATAAKEMTRALAEYKQNFDARASQSEKTIDELGASYEEAMTKLHVALPGLIERAVNTALDAREPEPEKPTLESKP